MVIRSGREGKGVDLWLDGRSLVSIVILMELGLRLIMT